MGIDSVRGRTPLDPRAVGAEGSGVAKDAAPDEASRREPFRADAPGAAAKADASGVAPVAASPLDQVRSGQIDVARYLDLKVEEATAHLKALPPGQLESIRSALRDRLATDPALADLVKMATGRLLPADEE
jgi:hypothetical protein